MKTKMVAVSAAALVAVAAGAVPSHAISDTSGKRKIGGGVSLEANSWECNLWMKACDWKTSAKAYKGSAKKSMTWIKNEAKVTGKGGSVSISAGSAGVSGSGSASTHSFTWKNTNKWISDLSGQARSGYLSLVWGIETCSYASTYHKSLGIKGTASACAG
ncbi:hypothetical protein [Streptomyces halobius]|uniref:Secreted protein n=1 Tax=Streptomyces halobius TaxID=2879846 RepID=A0ABY4MAM1_9ACTN|nr:hypothetical protein [Streptomyces halobius]UQA94821.1 hypothetical protein K9S39_25825 [Streptomyces halobius]